MPHVSVSVSPSERAAHARPERLPGVAVRRFSRSGAQGWTTAAAPAQQHFSTAQQPLSAEHPPERAAARPSRRGTTGAARRHRPCPCASTYNAVRMRSRSPRTRHRCDTDHRPDVYRDGRGSRLSPEQSTGCDNHIAGPTSLSSAQQPLAASTAESPPARPSCSDRFGSCSLAPRQVRRTPGAPSARGRGSARARRACPRRC